MALSQRGFFLPALLKFLGHHRQGAGAGAEPGSLDLLGPRVLLWEITPPMSAGLQHQHSLLLPVSRAKAWSQEEVFLGLCPPGQSSPLAGAKDYYNFSFPIIP